ncbi:MAG: T9SS type A sorting domain-containing protein [Crocinitomix sp.]|nr:T9SS type A sorting domain-containing protein [Crocinitomix sp.]
MKKYFCKFLSIATITLLGTVNSIAQCDNVNGDIETYTGTITSGNAWFNSNLTNWNVSHGVPEVTDAYYGTTLIAMSSYGDEGKGAYTDYSFVAGETYEISFDLIQFKSVHEDAEFVTRLSNGLTPNVGVSTYDVLPSLVGTQEVSTNDWVGVPFIPVWTTITTTITADANYSQYWLYTHLDGGTITNNAKCRVDNVCIKHVEIPRECTNINGDIETYSGTITNSPAIAGNTWINDDVDNWYVSHGSPYAMTSPTVNFEMWSQFGYGEGLYTEYDFVNGETYILTYDILKDATSNIESTFRVELTDDLSPQYSTTITLPGTSGNQDVSELDWIDSGTWITITQEFTVDAGGDYTQLWFYPLLKAAATKDLPRANCQIDNVCITRIKEVKEDQKQRQPENEVSELSSNSELVAYPNPSDGNFEMLLNNGENIEQVSVYGMTGNLVYQATNFNSLATISLNLSFLDKGLYTIIVNEGSSFTRIVIE